MVEYLFKNDVALKFDWKQRISLINVKYKMTIKYEIKTKMKVKNKRILDG